MVQKDHRVEVDVVMQSGAELQLEDPSSSLQLPVKP